jgi:hypothetical protein
VPQFAGALTRDQVAVVDGVEGAAVEEGVHTGIIRAVLNVVFDTQHPAL